MDLFNKASEQLQGKVDFRHAYLDFSKLEVTIPKQGGGSEVVKTCPASMGFAFAAGTTDGPGAFDFKQGDDQVMIIGNSLTPKRVFLYMYSVYPFDLIVYSIIYVREILFGGWSVTYLKLQTRHKLIVSIQSPSCSIPVK